MACMYCICERQILKFKCEFFLCCSRVWVDYLMTVLLPTHLYCSWEAATLTLDSLVAGPVWSGLGRPPPTHHL